MRHSPFSQKTISVKRFWNAQFTHALCLFLTRFLSQSLFVSLGVRSHRKSWIREFFKLIFHGMKRRKKHTRDLPVTSLIMTHDVDYMWVYSWDAITLIVFEIVPQWQRYLMRIFISSKLSISPIWSFSKDFTFNSVLCWMFCVFYISLLQVLPTIFANMWKLLTV